MQTTERASEVAAFCDAQGWYVTLELNPNMPEDVSDIERLLRGGVRERTLPSPAKPGRNEPCSCGSGLKFKKCHGKG